MNDSNNYSNCLIIYSARRESSLLKENKWLNHIIIYFILESWWNHWKIKWI